MHDKQKAVQPHIKVNYYMNLLVMKL